MARQKRNAVIMAAGTSSRFVPLSAETPKGLLEVKGEVLIERQIRQLREAGIEDIAVVVGYKAECFSYLETKFGVDIVLNEDFSRYNNTSSIIRVLDRLADTFICSSDNYFPGNVFADNPEHSYYSALYAQGETGEYCIGHNTSGIITEVSVGGHNAWYMIGHVYFSKDFSEAFKSLLAGEYSRDDVRNGYWEDVYISHIRELPPMRIKKYGNHEIEEFDSLDELRAFDSSYISDTRSAVIKEIAKRMKCTEDRLRSFGNIRHDGPHLLFSFMRDSERFLYNGQDNSIKKL